LVGVIYYISNKEESNRDIQTIADVASLFVVVGVVVVTGLDVVGAEVVV
jgi:hypothetical protein